MKNLKATPQKFLYLSSLSILVTIMTLIFGTPFLRAVRRTYGSLAYWGLGLFVSFIFWQLKAPLLLVFLTSLWIALGVQMNGEKRGFRWWNSAFLGLGVGALVGFASAYGILVSYELTTEESQLSLLQEFLAKLQTNQMKLNPKEMLQLMPGLFVVALELALGIGLVFEKQVFRWFDLPRERFVSQGNLLEYRLPDALIWFSLTMLLVAFVDFGSRPLTVLGLNFVYVVTILYFFQGLAIIEVFLRTIKSGFFGRFIVYFLMVGQLLPIVAFLGFADFWLDFRRRLRIVETKTKNTENKAD